MKFLFTFIVMLGLIPKVLFALHDNENIKINLLLESIDKESGIVKTIVEFRIQEGWHVYYKDPGDFGLPTQFTCKGHPDKIKVYWPKPLSISEEIGDRVFTSHIYEGYVLFPIEFYLSEKNSAINIELNIDYALCKTNCSPQTRKIILNTTLHDFMDKSVMELRKNFLYDNI